MRLLAIILLLICCSSVSHAQYFSKTYPLLSGLTNGYISNVQVVNDTIFAMCYVVDTISPYNGTALFDKFDKNGTLLSQNYFIIPNRTNIAVNLSNKTNDGGVVFGGYTQGMTATQNAILIMKYDSHGDMQWYKEITVPDSSAFHCLAFIQDKFSNYYFTGYIGNDSTYSTHSYVAKADSLGNLFSFKLLADSFFDNTAWGICINHKGNIVLGGAYGYEDPNDLTTSNGGYEIYELDTGLNLIQHVIGRDSIFGITAGYIQETGDGGYICGEAYSCYIDTFTIKNLGSISKLDSNFQAVWTTNTGHCSISTYFWQPTICPDGNYIAIGQSYNDEDTNTTHINGWIVKFTENGQILWSRLYRGITSDGTYGDNNILYTIAFFSDNSILCAGQAESLDIGFNQSNQQGWLLHLDTAGCLPDSNNCGIADGIADIPGYADFLVYPNPASSVFTVALAAPNDINGYNDLHFRLYDLTGRMVMDESIREQTTVLQRGGLTDGMYLWQIADGDKGLRNGKMVLRW